MRTTGWRLLVFALVAGCHSVAIRVERGSSGALERDDAFVPRPDAKGRYISMPPNGLVDCLDLLTESFGKKPCAERGDGLFDDLRRAADRSARGASADALHASVGRDGVTLEPNVPDGSYRIVVEHPGDAPLPDVSVRDGKLPAGIARRGDAVMLIPSLRPEAIAAFIHVSDGQIREPEAKLGGADVSHQLDPLVQSFEHDFEQELFSAFVYRAIITTVNREVELFADERAERHTAAERGEIDGRPRDRIMPSAAIHTGDAVDAGLVSEFADFRRISDELTIPWYQAVGNHDLLAFGNLQLMRKEELEGDHAADFRCVGAAWANVACTCTPVASLVREYNLRRPDNRGCEKEAVPSKAFTLIPVALEHVCMIHQVTADHFVMDPYHERRYTADGKINDAPGVRTSLGAFVAAHCRDGGCGLHLPDARPSAMPSYATAAPRPGANEAPAPDAPGPLPPVNDCGVARGGGAKSRINGFDLLWMKPTATASMALNARELAGRARLGSWSGPLGYYCFELEQEPGSMFARDRRRIWAFVLNTSTPRGAYGALSLDQLHWLDSRLDAIEQASPRDLVLVFAHHPIWGIYEQDERKTLSMILGEHDNVVGYFAGHTHDSQLRVVHPPGGHRFWEVVAPSTLVYPQQARLVTLKTSGDVGWFDVVSFSPHGEAESATYIDRALEGAKRDQCQQSPSSCADGRPKPPPREVTFPRLYFPMPGSPSAGWRAKSAAITDDATQAPTDGTCEEGWQSPQWYRSALDLRAPGKPHGTL